MKKRDHHKYMSGMDYEKEKLQAGIVLCMDLFALMLAYTLSNYIRLGSLWDNGLPIDGTASVFYLLTVYLLVYFFRGSSRAFFRRGPWAEFVIVFKRNLYVLIVIVITLYFVKEAHQMSRLIVVYTMVLSIAIMYTFHSFYKLYLLKHFQNSIHSKRLIILTTSGRVEEILDRLRSANMWEYTIKGLILVDENDGMIGKEIKGIPVIGNYATMYRCVTNRVVDEIFIHVPYTSGIHLAKVIETYEDMGVPVSVNIHVFDLPLRHRQKELKEFGGYYTVCFRESVIGVRMLVIKRAMDIVGSIVGLIFTAVITAFLAPPLLLESPGKLIFSQVRVGRNGRKFKMYKFRSMYKDAEDRKKELMAQNEMKGLMFKMENDPRITKVGAFIRKTSIDEFPQFWNVLRGDMSLIGTRPPTLDEYERYEIPYKRRLSIRPGITGMWQVSGRSDITDFEEVLKLDLEYIDNWSVGLDVKILVKTVFGAVMGRGAK